MEKSSVYFTVLEACNLKGCPVCSLITKTARSYIKNMLYENVNDGEVRASLRQSLGLCRPHASLMMKGGDYFGIAIIYQDILDHIRSDLREGQVESLFPKKECPVCSYRRTMEINYLGIFADFLPDLELKQALQLSGGLCLVHLSQFLDQFADPNDRREILNLHVRTLGEIRRNLSGFVRKQDIHFQNELVSHEEETACERAIDCLIGKSA